MSWSRGFSGTVAEVLASFRAAQSEIEKGLPDFEKGDVAHVVAAAGVALEAVPAGATVSLSVGGHGYQNTAPQPGETARNGAVNLSINYTLAAPAAES